MINLQLTNPKAAEWRQTPHYAQWLREMITTQEGALFMAVLQEMAKPCEDFYSVMNTTGDVQAKMAFNHCLVSGQNQTIQNIREMTVPAPIIEDDDE